MDFQHFDHVTRALSSVGTRRRAFGLLTALPVVGGLLALPGAEDVLAKHRNHHQVDQEKKKKACKPQSTATVCVGKCGTVSNAQTCNKPVNCGPCNCATPCGACFVCDPTTRTCKVDPKQVGEACGSSGQVCAADGTCACTPATCAVQGKTCGTISDGCGGTLACGSCSNPTPVCSDNVCVGCSNDAVCGSGLVCCGGSCVVGTWSNQTTFGSEGSGLSQFNSPDGAAVLTDGLTAWVADAANSRISVWTRPDATSTDWTNQTTFGSEGSGLSQFDYPEDVAVSPDGLTVWVADSGNNDRISIWSLGCPAQE